jgi:hypothetical protein
MPTVMKPVDLADIEDPCYPMLATIKIDGIRAYVRDGVLYSCSDSPIPNQFLQQLAPQLPEGADFEFFFESFRKTQEIVMAKRAIVPVGMTCNIFDIIPFTINRDLGYIDRLRILKRWFGSDYETSQYSFFTIPSFQAAIPTRSRSLYSFTPGPAAIDLFSTADPLPSPYMIASPIMPKELIVKYNAVAEFRVQVRFVRPYTLHTREDLESLTEFAVSQGLEGVMLRTANSKYKFGRSTPRSAELIRFKPFKDAEAIVVGYEPIYTNGNEIYAPSKRSTAASGLTAIPRLGAFRCVPFSHEAYEEVQFRSESIKSERPRADPIDAFALTGFDSVFGIGNGVGLTHALRDQLWQDRSSLIGKIIKFKYLPVGEYDAPRSGVFLSFRDIKDLS